MASERPEAAPHDEEATWRATWSRLLARFEEEAGDPPGRPAEGAEGAAAALEPWEAELLGRLLAEELQSGGGPGPARRRPRRGRARPAPGAAPGAEAGEGGGSLAACEARLRRAAARARAERAAGELLAEAAALERAGDLAGACGACRRALALGPARPVEARLRLAQLLRAARPAPAGGGTPGDACEAELRRALGECPAAAVRRPGGRRDALARLALLLCQEGREDEALPLLQLGGWRLRLAPWVLRYGSTTGGAPEPSSKVQPSSAEPAQPPLRVFDDALPQELFATLRRVFKPGSEFWREHGYNELQGSGEAGYFSYLHKFPGPAESAMDPIIHHIWSVARTHFPLLSAATAAEWWAHCRPHTCGHQMHFDSDNEGIGGPKHPICSCVVYVEAPAGVGGPTLVTDQRAGDELLATNGWLVYPRQGRLAVYDGSVLHGRPLLESLPAPAWCPAGGSRRRARRPARGA